MDRIGIVGDIHGEYQRLCILLDAVAAHTDELIFVGDYVNRGAGSADVIERLVALTQQGVRCTFLAGNHDRQFLRAVKDGDLGAFLQIGGAATVRSYVRDPIAPDVAGQFITAVPRTHVTFLESLKAAVVTNDLVVAHSPAELEAARLGSTAFGVCGHVPQIGNVPAISDRTAYIDTGCGTSEDGRLTCLFWPSRQWVQA